MEKTLAMAANEVRAVAEAAGLRTYAATQPGEAVGRLGGQRRVQVQASIQTVADLLVGAGYEYERRVHKFGTHWSAALVKGKSRVALWDEAAGTMAVIRQKSDTEVEQDQRAAELSLAEERAMEMHLDGVDN